MALQIPIGENDELKPGKTYRQVYDLKLPGLLERESVADLIGRLIVTLRNVSSSIHVLAWETRPKPQGDFELILDFEVLPETKRGIEPAVSVELAAAPAVAALTPLIVRGIIVGALGLLGVIGLYLILRITYVLVGAKEIFETLAFPLSLGLTALVISRLSGGKEAGT